MASKERQEKRAKAQRYSTVSSATLDPKMFERFPTGKAIDFLFSDKGGLMRATVTMVIGDPGVGKTTILSDTIADIQIQYPTAKILFISSEESLIDRAYNQAKSPKTKELPTLFLGEMDNKKQVIEEAFAEGWDIILVDSFKDTQDKVQAEVGNTIAETENWLLNLMVSTSQGKNKKKVYTAFACIQQVTKGREFIGSNSLKHNTTAMMEMRFDKENPGQRYVEFTKNRRAGAAVGRKLYYTFNEETQELNYTEEAKAAPIETETSGSKSLPNRRYSHEELCALLPESMSIEKKGAYLKKMKDDMNAGKPISLPC